MFARPPLAPFVPPDQAALWALAEKAMHAQWSAADVLDGTGDGAPREWLPTSFRAAIVSQLYHGELATIRMCRTLLPALDDPAARRLVEFQIEDETRHAAVYWAYLESIGPLQPPDPVLAAAYEKALSWGPDDGAMLAAYTIILEGEALFALNYLGRWFRCPRFRRINAAVSRDEARHFAFGKLYLRCLFPGLARGQRLDVYGRLNGLWRDAAFAVPERFRIPDFLLRRRCRTWVETGWRDHRRALIGLGLVSPAEAAGVEGGGA